ncbi:MAG: polysaccharide deacetylase family protein [Synergistaceae bacterium]|nr:polysaccharide deacetylase family protein [Synergistaceae bacterium]
MKAAKLFTALVILAMTFTASDAQDNWARDKLDARKALPNVTSSPARKVPVNALNPVKKAKGIIRRVNLYNDGIKACALTFDMCELDTVTTGCDMDVINFLREKNIPATLFMGGKWMRTHSRRVKQIMTAKNFEIANHNWSHGNCALLSQEGLKAQILWTQAQYELLREEAGLEDVQPVPTLFRLPYGRSSESAVRTINELGLKVIQWDVAAEAGDNSNIRRAKKSAKLVANMTRPGSILLFHANLVPKGTINLLRELVSILQDKGYEFVKVSELLEMGEPETAGDGYFTRPGDNRALDKKFGVDGTGRKTRFTGK